MKRILDFLKDNKVFYLATVDGDKPRVRPFGAAASYNGRLALGTSNDKDVYKQLCANPNAELCACSPEGAWLRVYGKLTTVTDPAAKELFYAEFPRLHTIYGGDREKNFTIVAFERLTAKFQSMDGKTEEITL